MNDPRNELVLPAGSKVSYDIYDTLMEFVLPNGVKGEACCESINLFFDNNEDGIFYIGFEIIHGDGTLRIERKPLIGEPEAEDYDITLEEFNKIVAADDPVDYALRNCI